jgi:hypothetical protein
LIVSLTDTAHREERQREERQELDHRVNALFRFLLACHKAAGIEAQPIDLNTSALARKSGG